MTDIDELGNSVTELITLGETVAVALVVAEAGQSKATMATISDRFSMREKRRTLSSSPEKKL